MPPSLHRPEPLLRHAAQLVDRKTPPQRAAAQLRDGRSLVVTDIYSTGLKILAQLRVLMPPPAPDASYEVRRESRRAYREASERLLAPVIKHRLALKEAPAIGFLRQLYPDHPTFVLSLVEVLDLLNAWKVYQEGIHLSVLGYRVHPFYGTYVPARVSHLELFGTWLSQYKGPRTRAIDVGTGCGVLALMLCKAGFDHVLATDNNPNAIESVRREIKELPSRPPLQPLHGDLLGDDPGKVDLVVFNPPWMQGPVESLLDSALYFEDGLFERFFEQASARLTPKGRIVLVFSNLIQLVQPDTPHPIHAELERGRFTEVQKLSRKVKPTPSKDRPKRTTKERVEVWELARR